MKNPSRHDATTPYCGATGVVRFCGIPRTKSAGAYPVNCPVKLKTPRELVPPTCPVMSLRNSTPAIRVCAPEVKLICSEPCHVLSLTNEFVPMLEKAVKPGTIKSGIPGLL